MAEPINTSQHEAEREEDREAVSKEQPSETPRPTKPAERIVTLDILRGVAILGILLVNIELVRGSDIYGLMAGHMPDYSGVDSLAHFLVGWLALSKFLTCFALLFGIGAAIMTRRAYAAGASPRRMLARRYGWLAVFGLAHMLLLFFGDILFLYALCGFLLLLFINLRPRALLIWAGSIMGFVALIGAAFTIVSAIIVSSTEESTRAEEAAFLNEEEQLEVPTDTAETPEELGRTPNEELFEENAADAGEAALETTDVEAGAKDGTATPSFENIFASADGWENFITAHRKRVSETYREGPLGRQLLFRAIEAAFFQAFSLSAAPWILGLFLCGLALGRSSLLVRLTTERGLLRRITAFCIPIGLLLNIPLGIVGPLGASSMGPSLDVPILLAISTVMAQMIGVPVLAVGYLSGLALLCHREGFLRRAVPLERTGRMALTAYLSQSLLCATFFVGLGYYDSLTPATGLLVVLAVWVILLVFCTIWMGRFQMGPIERLWRRLTYGPSR